MTDPTYEGSFIPEYCPRGRTDCKALSQIISEGHASFLCCGENDGTARTVEQDKYRMCIKSSEDNDIMTDCDKRDLIHEASVIMGALAIIENTDCAAYHVTAEPAEAPLCGSCAHWDKGWCSDLEHDTLHSNVCASYLVKII